MNIGRFLGGTSSVARRSAAVNAANPSRPGDTIEVSREGDQMLQQRFDQADRPILTVASRAVGGPRARADGSIPGDGEDFDIDVCLLTDDAITMRLWTNEQGQLEFNEILSVEGLDLSDERWPVPCGMNHNPWRVEDQIGVASTPRWVLGEDGINRLMAILHVSGDHPQARRIRTGRTRNFSADYVVDRYRDITGQDGLPSDMTTYVAVDWTLLGFCAVLFPADARAKTEIRAAFPSRLIEGDKDMTLATGFRALKSGVQGRSGTPTATPTPTPAADTAPVAPAPAPAAPVAPVGQAAPVAPTAPTAPAAPIASDAAATGATGDQNDAFARAQADFALITRGNELGMDRSFVTRHLGRGVSVEQLTNGWHDLSARNARDGRDAIVIPHTDPFANSPRARFAARREAMVRAAVAHNVADLFGAESPQARHYALRPDDTEARAVRSVGICDIYREALAWSGITGERGLTDNSRISEHMAGLAENFGRSVAPEVLGNFQMIATQTLNTVMLSANNQFPFQAALFMRTVQLNGWYAAATMIMNEIDDLEDLVEGQEIPAGGFQIFDDYLILTSQGKRYPMSRQLVESNAGNVFSDFARNVIKASNRGRTKKVNDMIKRNKVMKKDNTPFFHESRGNVIENAPLSDQEGAEATMAMIFEQIAQGDPSMLNQRLKLVVSFKDLPAARKLNSDKVVANSQDGVPVYAGMFDIIPYEGLPLDANGRSAWLICVNPDDAAFLVNVERAGQGEPIVKIMEPEAYDAIVAKVIHDTSAGYGNPYRGVLAFSGPAPEQHTLSNGEVVAANYGL